MSDRRLIEWVAQASVGDAFPEPYSFASSPLESVILTLVSRGVMNKPTPGTDWAAVAAEASTSAQAWLEQNPDAGKPPWMR